MTTIKTGTELEQAITDGVTDFQFDDNVRTAFPWGISRAGETVNLSGGSVRSTMEYEGHPSNQFAITAESAFVRNMGFRGGNMHGALLKFQAIADRLAVTGCRFDDVGTVWTPIDAAPGKRDFATTQVISGHDLSGATVNIVGNVFQVCALNARRHSHCLYIDGDFLTAAANTFIGCGNPFALGRSGVTKHIVVAGNTVLHPAPTIDPRREVRPGYLMDLHKDVSTSVTGTTVIGPMDCPFAGDANPQKHWIDHNDWSGLILFNPAHWAVVDGQWVDYAKWQELGFDRNSKGPQT